MKPELTKELKSIFYAQYIGQEVIETPTLVWTGNPPEPSHDEWGPNILTFSNIEKIIEVGFPLNLRDMSSLKNKEALEVAKIVNGDDGWQTAKDGRKAIAQLDFTWPSPRDIGHLNDYLRSIGVAIGFRGYSVEELDNIGWIKLI